MQTLAARWKRFGYSQINAMLAREGKAHATTIRRPTGFTRNPGCP